jgi:hypothetical protein
MQTMKILLNICVCLKRSKNITKTTHTHEQVTKNEINTYSQLF